MTIQLRCLRQEEWPCPSQIQNWLLCFPGPLRASGCTGDLRLLPSAQGWTIVSWGRRPIAGNRLQFLSSRKCMRRWLGLGAMQLCLQGTTAWSGKPCLLPRACKFSCALMAKAYGAAGQAASALHAMALLQVHQAKSLKQLHEGGADPGVLQELRTATDLTLRATKVTVRALGQKMSTLVVQERHLWLTLVDMREADKHRFLDSLISQAGLFGEAVEDFAQQFSAARSRRRRFVTSCPRWHPLLSPPYRWLQPLHLLIAESALLLPPPLLQLGHSSSLHNGHSVELAARKRRSLPPPLPSPWNARAGGVPETGDPVPLDPALQEMMTAPLLSPEESRVKFSFSWPFKKSTCPG